MKHFCPYPAQKKWADLSRSAHFVLSVANHLIAIYLILCAKFCLFAASSDNIRSSLAICRCRFTGTDDIQGLQEPVPCATAILGSRQIIDAAGVFIAYTGPHNIGAANGGQGQARGENSTKGEFTYQHDKSPPRWAVWPSGQRSQTGLLGN